MIRYILSVLLIAGLLLSGSAPGYASARRAPAFKLKDINGRTYDIKKSLGKDVIVVNFWATWCAPCQAEMPGLDELYRKYKKDGLEMLAISIDDPKSADQVKPIIKQNRYKFTVLMDMDSRVVTLYNPKKILPFTAVIDRAGNVVHERIGYEPGAEKDLEGAVRGLLGLDKSKEKEPKKEEPKPKPEPEKVDG